MTFSFRRGVVLLAVSTAALAAPLAAQTSKPGAQTTSQDVTPNTPPPVTRNAGVIPYRIAAGDEIEVYVWGEDRLSRVIHVLPDGTIAMPLVGQLNAQGLLPEQLQEAITKRLASQFRGPVPQVTVSVRSATGVTFSIIGKVRSPGAFTPGRYVNLLEALTLAGGPADFANLDNISIVRRNGTSIRARMGKVLRDGVPNGTPADQALPRIEGGDTIIVP